MNINEIIKQKRIEKNISQRELGRRIDKTGQFISLIEKGTNKPSIDTLKDIAEALDVSIIDLIGDNLQIEEQEPTSEYKTIYVDDLIEQLEKFRGGKVAFVYIGEGNIQIDIDKFKDIRIEEAWGKCPEEDKKDITINIK